MGGVDDGRSSLAPPRHSKKSTCRTAIARSDEHPAMGERRLAASAAAATTTNGEGSKRQDRTLDMSRRANETATERAPCSMQPAAAGIYWTGAIRGGNIAVRSRQSPWTTHAANIEQSRGRVGERRSIQAYACIPQHVRKLTKRYNVRNSRDCALSEVHWLLPQLVSEMRGQLALGYLIGSAESRSDIGGSQPVDGGMPAERKSGSMPDFR
jgi:hypothetical protein